MPNYHDTRKLAGLCVRCGRRQPEKNRTRCRWCKAKQNATMRRWTHARKADHAQPADPHHDAPQRQQEDQ